MKGLIEIFYAPGKVFDFVRERRVWVIPFIANLLLFAISYYYVTDAIGAGNIVRHSLETSRFAAQMPEDAKEKAIADAEQPSRKMMTLGFTAVTVGIAYVVFALLFMAVSAVGGGKLKFSQALGTVSYASWPISVVRFLLTVLVVAITADKTELDPQRILAFNGGAFLDKATTAKPLFALASSFDLILFAQIAFAAWGLSRVAQIGFVKALVGLGVIWMIFTLIGMGFSLVF